MRKVLLLASLVLLCVTSVARAQSPSVRSSLTATTQSVILTVNTLGSASIQVQGTWSGTLTFYGSVTCDTFTTLSVIPLNSTTTVTTATANGIWNAPVGGLSCVKVAFTSYTSGSADVMIQAAPSGNAMRRSPFDQSLNTTDNAAFNVVCLGAAQDVCLRRAASGELSFTDAAGANVTALHFGPATASFPELLVVGTTLKASTGDGVTASTLAAGAFQGFSTTPSVGNVGANSCGTSAASLIGTDSNGVITVGATAGTQCRVTFTVAAPSTRECTVTDSTTTVATRATYVDTTHTDFLGAFVAGDKVTYLCMVR